MEQTAVCFIGVMVTRLPPKEKIVGSSPIWNGCFFNFSCNIEDQQAVFYVPFLE